MWSTFKSCCDCLEVHRAGRPYQRSSRRASDESNMLPDDEASIIPKDKENEKFEDIDIYDSDEEIKQTTNNKNIQDEDEGETQVNLQPDSTKTEEDVPTQGYQTDADQDKSDERSNSDEECSHMLRVGAAEARSTEDCNTSRVTRITEDCNTSRVTGNQKTVSDDDWSDSRESKMPDLTRVNPGKSAPVASSTDDKPDSLQPVVRSVDYKPDTLQPMVQFVVDKPDSLQTMVRPVDDKTDSLQPMVRSVDDKSVSLHTMVQSVADKLDSLQPMVRSVDDKSDSLQTMVRSVDDEPDSMQPMVQSVDDKLDSLQPMAQSVDDKSDSLQPMARSVDDKHDSLHTMVGLVNVKPDKELATEPVDNLGDLQLVTLFADDKTDKHKLVATLLDERKKNVEAEGMLMQGRTHKVRRRSLLDRFLSRLTSERERDIGEDPGSDVTKRASSAEAVTTRQSIDDPQIDSEDSDEVKPRNKRKKKILRRISLPGKSSSSSAGGGSTLSQAFKKSPKKRKVKSNQVKKAVTNDSALGDSCHGDDEESPTLLNDNKRETLHSFLSVSQSRQQPDENTAHNTSHKLTKNKHSTIDTNEEEMQTAINQEGLETCQLLSIDQECEQLETLAKQSFPKVKYDVYHWNAAHSTDDVNCSNSSSISKSLSDNSIPDVIQIDKIHTDKDDTSEHASELDDKVEFPNCQHRGSCSLSLATSTSSRFDRRSSLFVRMKDRFSSMSSSSRAWTPIMSKDSLRNIDQSSIEDGFAQDTQSYEINTPHLLEGSWYRPRASLPTALGKDPNDRARRHSVPCSKGETALLPLVDPTQQQKLMSRTLRRESRLHECVSSTPVSQSPSESTDSSQPRSRPNSNQIHNPNQGGEQYAQPAKKADGLINVLHKKSSGANVASNHATGAGTDMVTPSMFFHSNRTIAVGEERTGSGGCAWSVTLNTSRRSSLPPALEHLGKPSGRLRELSEEELTDKLVGYYKEMRNAKNRRVDFLERRVSLSMKLANLNLEKNIER